MELRALAEAILFGETLAEKLTRPQTLSDANPGAALVRAPELPGRAPELRPREAPSAFPRALATRREQAQVLLSFANHELQALELQALALLRFPDAPPAFRLELAQVLVEEQEHLRLYLERARALGYDVEDAPRSRFLWDALSGMAQPLDYVSGLALTFEQANLDFARDYEARFRALGDETTAAVLARVYAEEVGHVRLGVQWLRHYTSSGDDWEAYTRALPQLLTPRRARGTGDYQREARLEAGLSERFVAELEVAGGSRGRPPDLLWFRPGAERLAAGGARKPSESHLQLERDLAPLLACAARPDDLVLVGRLPSLAWRRQLAALGFPPVEWVELPAQAHEVAATVQAALGERLLGRLRPWAWDPHAARALAPLGQPALDPVAFAALSQKAWAAARWAEVREPAWAPLLVADEGRTLDTAAELNDLSPQDTWRVLKAGLASSGEGLRRLAPGEAPDANLLGWARRALAQGPLRLEPWHERAADLSLVFEVEAEGIRATPELTVPICDARGRYRGHWVGPPKRFLAPEVLRLLHESRADADGASGLQVLEATARAVARSLAAAGYRGPAGIDALVAREGDELRLRPLLEVNVRWTFGHLARALAARLRPGRVARLDLVPKARWGAAPVDWVASLPTPRREGGRLVAGVLALTDPSQAEACLALLSVASTPDEVAELLSPWESAGSGAAQSSSGGGR